MLYLTGYTGGMSKEGTLITIGVLVLLTPFLGLPSSWLAWILPILGVITLAIGQLIRKERTAPRLASVEAPAAPIISMHDAPSHIA